jgi:DNA modification methylase
MTPYYEDEAVTLYHGDCREILPQLSPVEHVITDPPYARDVYVRMSMPATKAGSGSPARLGVNVKGENWTKRQGGALAKLAAGDIGAIDEMLDGVARDIGRLLQRWALVFSDVETCFRWRQQLEDAGLRYVRTGAWVKPDAMPQMSGDRPAVGFEPCTIAHAQGPMRWNGGGRQAVWTYGTCKVDRPDHPCPKPEPLMAHLVRDFTDEGETILDPFMGSGTTLVAAKRLGRKAIGIEREEKYCEIAAKRLAQGSLFQPARDIYEPAPRRIWEAEEPA